MCPKILFRVDPTDGNSEGLGEIVKLSCALNRLLSVEIFVKYASVAKI